MADLNIQLKQVSGGETTNINPITTAKNTSVTPNNNVPSTATDSQAVFDSLGEMAFSDGSNIAYLSESSDYDGTLPDSEIDDTTTSVSSTWSSSRLKTIFELLGVTFDDSGNPSVS